MMRNRKFQIAQVILGLGVVLLLIGAAVSKVPLQIGGTAVIIIAAIFPLLVDFFTLP